MISPPPFDNVLALFEYEAPISSLIHQLKFSGNLLIARWLATQWIDYLKNMNTLPDLILPVPLHHTRLKDRGFNQALEIAKPIGQYFHIPIDTRSCIRIKNTEAQSSLPASKRKYNLKNAFGLSHSLSANHIAILDDVVTTGNTVSEIAFLLRKIGVKKIDVWCCAQTRK
jgi:ComF family protein